MKYIQIDIIPNGNITWLLYKYYYKYNIYTYIEGYKRDELRKKT